MVILRLALLLVVGSQAFAGPLDDAFNRLYNFDFPGAQSIVTKYIAANPSDPLGYGVRAAGYLYSEFDRLQILESQFFEDDKRIIAKKKLQADPKMRDAFDKAIVATREKANAVLATHPNDTNAIFSLSIADGLLSDYDSLIDKRTFASLAAAKEAQTYSLRLLKIDPNYIDAYLTTGFSEYLVDSLYFFVRWFVHFDGIKGDKEVAIQQLEKVAQHGRYLKGFAKILLAIAFLRAQEPEKAKAMLQELIHDYPGNPLYRKELAKIETQLKSARK